MRKNIGMGWIWEGERRVGGGKERSRVASVNNVNAPIGSCRGGVSSPKRTKGKKKKRKEEWMTSP